jgi:hypothetical protein
MRRRLEKFLPIVLIALVVQILAPIGACWAAAIAVSDPLQAAEICHTTSESASGQADQGGGHAAHDGACAICCVLHANVSLNTPYLTAFATPYRESERVLWRNDTVYFSTSRSGSNSQARAPPQAI